MDWVDLLSPSELRRDFQWLALQGEGEGGTFLVVCVRTYVCVSLATLTQ